MRYQKLIAVPVIFILLVLIYANVINSLEDTLTAVRETPNNSKSGFGEVIGVGQAVTVKVTRATSPYLFGLVNLPNYAQGFGDLKAMNTIFFWSLYAFTIVLTAVIIIIERRQTKMKIAAPKVQFSKPNIWIRLAKSLGIGALFALVAFLLSNDPSSIPLGLLVAYIEFRQN
ncbi:MAG: hypothetical protein HYT70_02555 [Candidatus Aenigmarchaeota archaeon]|nr:hypothetical protein [Candidatus Aenigmarchaeota archaeon]